MKYFLNKNNFWSALRLGLGLLFIYASFYKIATPGAFAHQIYNYKILPWQAINPLAITLPWMQLFCGVSLFLNRGAKGSSLVLILMMAVFQIAVASALLRGLNISCGCFKSGGGNATWFTFARDFILLGLMAIQYWKSLQNGFTPGLWMDAKRHGH